MTQKLTLEYVKVMNVHPNPWNPHGTTEDEMDALIESIGVNGMIDAPLVVEWDADIEYNGDIHEAREGYLIVDGEQKTMAYKNAFMRGLTNSPDIPVLVMGKLSEFGKQRLAELGQVLNHKGRGSLENEEKTAVITQWLMKNRSLEEVAKTMGQHEAFLKRSLSSLAATQRASSPTPNKTPNGGSGSKTERPTGYKERNTLNVVLPFEDELAVDEFESLITLVLSATGDDDLPATKGNKRVYAVMEALRNFEKDAFHGIGDE